MKKCRLAVTAGRILLFSLSVTVAHAGQQGRTNIPLATCLRIVGAVDSGLNTPTSAYLQLMESVIQKCRNNLAPAEFEALLALDGPANPFDIITPGLNRSETFAYSSSFERLLENYGGEIDWNAVRVKIREIRDKIENTGVRREKAQEATVSIINPKMHLEAEFTDSLIFGALPPRFFQNKNHESFLAFDLYRLGSFLYDFQKRQLTKLFAQPSYSHFFFEDKSGKSWLATTENDLSKGGIDGTRIVLYDIGQGKAAYSVPFKDFPGFLEYAKGHGTNFHPQFYFLTGPDDQPLLVLTWGYNNYDHVNTLNILTGETKAIIQTEGHYEYLYLRDENRLISYGLTKSSEFQEVEVRDVMSGEVKFRKRLPLADKSTGERISKTWLHLDRLKGKLYLTANYDFGKVSVFEVEGDSGVSLDVDDKNKWSFVDAHPRAILADGGVRIVGLNESLTPVYDFENRKTHFANLWKYVAADERSWAKELKIATLPHGQILAVKIAEERSKFSILVTDLVHGGESVFKLPEGKGNTWDLFDLYMTPDHRLMAVVGAGLKSGSAVPWKPRYPVLIVQIYGPESPHQSH